MQLHNSYVICTDGLMTVAFDELTSEGLDFLTVLAPLPAVEGHEDPRLFLLPPGRDLGAGPRRTNSMRLWRCTIPVNFYIINLS